MSAMSDAMAKLEAASKAVLDAGTGLTLELAAARAEVATALAEVTRLAAALEDCQHPKPAVRVGISPGAFSTYTSDEMARQLDDMRAIGITDFRYAINWSAFEKPQGVYNLGRLLEIGELCEARDIVPLPCITYNPPYYRPAGQEGNPYTGPTSLPAVKRMGKAVAVKLAELESKKREWWNEANLVYWQPPDPAFYARSLWAFYQGLLEGDPLSEVVTTGLAPAKDGTTTPRRSINPATFLAELYARLGKDGLPARPFWTGVGFHPYMGGVAPDSTATWSTMGPIYDRMVATIHSQPAPHPKLYATEAGYATRGERSVSEELQADYLIQQIELWRQRPDAGPFYIHRWVDFAPGQFPGQTAYNESLGLRNPDYSPKKAVDALREYLT